MTIPARSLISARMGVLRKTGPMSVVNRRVSAAEFADRCRERDQRQAADDRNEVQRWLGDPPRYRSALSQHKPGEE